MNKSSNNWRVFLKSAWFGIVAGMISGMVKIDWEKTSSSRTLTRDVANPSQHMLQQVGVSYKFTHTYMTHNTDQKTFWVALILYFSFSIFFTWLLIYMVQFKKTAWAGPWEGTLYGIIIWVVRYLIIMPVLGTIPAPWQMPFTEHFSEFFDHIVWGWSIAAVDYYLIAKQKVKTLTNQYW